MLMTSLMSSLGYFVWRENILSWRIIIVSMFGNKLQKFHRENLIRCLLPDSTPSLARVKRISHAHESTRFLCGASCQVTSQKVYFLLWGQKPNHSLYLPVRLPSPLLSWRPCSPAQSDVTGHFYIFVCPGCKSIEVPVFRTAAVRSPDGRNALMSESRQEG